MNRFVKCLCLAVGFAATLAGCTSPVTNDQPKTGNLIISAKSPGAARTIMPSDTDIAITTYVFSGTGPSGSGATIAETSQSSPSFSAPSIAVGAWSIIVNGKNAAGVLVASKTTTVMVPAGATANETVQLAQLTGTGTLIATVDWTGAKTSTGAAVSVDSVTGTLTPDGGSPLVITITGTQATITTTAPAGSYILAVNLAKDGQAIAAPVPESVVVYSTYTSSGPIALTDIDFSGVGFVAIPVLSLAASTYNAVQTLTMSTLTTGASIWYTTDGSIPTPTATGGTSSLYETGSSISITTSKTVKAIAYLKNWTYSPIASATYVLACAAPTFSVVAGTHAVAQTLTLSTTTAGATIYYTTDNSEPSSTSSVYSVAIDVGTSQTIKAFVYRAGWTSSAVTSAAYTIVGTVSAPTFSPSAGTYTSAQSVTLSPSTPGSSIYYTIDGSTPTDSSTAYTTGAIITVGATQTIRAIAYYGGAAPSVPVSAAYTINGIAALTVLAPPRLAITLSGVRAAWDTSLFSTMTVSSTVTSPVSSAVDSYAWYLDGSAIAGATASSVVLPGTPLQAGPHSLALLAKSGSTVFSTRSAFSVASGYFAMLPISTGSYTRSDGTSTVAVTLSAFKMSKYDITQSQYQSITGVNPSSYKANSDAAACPVEMVTWYDAVEFCNKLSDAQGKTPVYSITARIPATGYPITKATVSATWSNNGYRLPTEAQWEYAARAGTTTTAYWGNATDDATVGQNAWFTSNSGAKTHAVGQKLPNAFGLYDIMGNVWQYCWDLYDIYPVGALTDPTGPVTTADPKRVARGGAYMELVTRVTSAGRAQGDMALQTAYAGFRVVAP